MAKYRVYLSSDFQIVPKEQATQIKEVDGDAVRFLQVDNSSAQTMKSEGNPYHDEEGKFTSAGGGRAPKGGTVGVNREQYQGGQFLPRSPETIKGAQKREQEKKEQNYLNKKQQVAPYTWEKPPTTESKTIFSAVGYAHASYDHDAKIFKVTEKNKEIVGKLVSGGTWAKGSEDYDAPIFNGWSANELVEKFNRGERWFEPKQETMKSDSHLMKWDDTRPLTEDEMNLLSNVTIEQLEQVKLDIHPTIRDLLNAQPD